MKIVGRLKPGATMQARRLSSRSWGNNSRASIRNGTLSSPRLVPLAQHVSGASESGSVRAGLRRRCRDVDCVRESFESAIGEVGRAAKGNGDAGRVGSRTFSAAAADAHRERGALLLRRGVGTGPRRGRHARDWRISMHSTFLCSKAFGSMDSALAFTLLAAVASGVLFGLLPALRVTALSLREGMQDASRGSSGGKRHAWVRDGLVVSELAFACILLVGAGLLIRSFLRVLDVNLGISTGASGRAADRPEFPDLQSRAAELLYRRCAAAAPALSPALLAAGITDVLPLRDDRSWAVSAVGTGLREEPPAAEPFIRVVSDGYFEAAGIPLRLG